MSHAIDPTAGLELGGVACLDTGATVVELAGAELLPRVTVNDLVAVQGRADTEWLIALVQSVGAGADGEAPEITLGLVGMLETGERVRFTRGAHKFPTVGASCHLLDGELLRRFLTLLGAELPPEERLVLGRFAAEESAEAIADGNKMFQRHLALLGSSGSGKSWTVSLLLDRAARLAHTNMIVLDMHGEYWPLTQGPNAIARGLRIAGAGDGPSEDVIFVPYWLLDRDEMLTLILDESDPDAASQAMRFTDHVFKLKRGTLFEVGLEEVAQTFTVDSPIPYRLDTLMAWLDQDNTEKILRQPSGKVELGPYYDRLARFIGRLEARISDARYRFMFQPPPECLEYEWLDGLVASLLDAVSGPGIKIIDFSEVPSEALPVVAGVIARLLYDVQFWMDPAERTPLAFVCDEAHLYLPAEEERQPVHRVSLKAFEQIAKEGRKYGVGLVVVTQRPADVSRTIIAQCNNFIVMRLTNDRDKQVIQQLVPSSLGRITDVLPLLDVGEAIMLGDAVLLPSPVRFDAAAIKPASETRAFWTDWGGQRTSAEAVVDGVEALRRQMRSHTRPVELA